MLVSGVFIKRFALVANVRVAARPGWLRDARLGLGVFRGIHDTFSLGVRAMRLEGKPERAGGFANSGQ
ncbi:hypothetical protein bcgnr5380_62770 [Bacillus cereus]